MMTEPQLNDPLGLADESVRLEDEGEPSGGENYSSNGGGKHSESADAPGTPSGRKTGKGTGWIKGSV